MCVICGCDTGAGHEHAQVHDHAQALPLEPAAGVALTGGTGDLHFGTGAARASAPGMSQARAIKLEADVLDANRRMAQRNRAHFAAHGVTAFNLVSSPGSGKTALLCALIGTLQTRMPGLSVSVIEGDQQTSLDAERIRATGAPAIQVNTGRGCHLNAQMVGEAFARLDLHDDAHRQPQGADALLFIENVGNLVCPAMWDLGEAAKIVILSVTEGEDKPLKYPDMFAAATLMLINKIDLLPHVDFDVHQCIEYARCVNPVIEVILISAKRGTGMAACLDWLLAYREERHHGQLHRAQGDAEGALHERIEAFEQGLATDGATP